MCSQRSTAETQVARQRLARHVFTATDKHGIITAGDGDLYSVRPEVIKGGQVIHSFGIRP
jgi:hypothetical protein